MKNIDDCYDHYLKKEVSLLAGVFENFNDTYLRAWTLSLF